MRTALALATALAGSIVGIAATSAPAHAETCEVPRVSGFNFSGLTAHGISCHEAQTHAVHTLRHGAPAGWTCSHRIAGRSVSFSCHRTHDASHSDHFSYHVQ